MNSQLIHGDIKVRQPGAAVPPLRVEAWGTRHQQAILLGSAQTDVEGRFVIRLQKSCFDRIFTFRHRYLSFRVYLGQKLITNTEPMPVWEASSTNAPVQILVDLPPAPVEPAKPPVVRTRAVGRLLAESSDLPLAGYRIHGSLPTGDGKPVDLGWDITNPAGLFVIAVPKSDPGENPTVQILQLTVLDSGSREFGPLEFRVEPGRKEPAVVRVPLPEKPEDTSPRLDALAETLHLTLPGDLLANLSGRGIDTLDDIRAAGGLGHLEDLPVAPDDPALQTLEAHAALGLLPSDPPTNQRLIDAGYTGVAAIAGTTRAEFVSALHAEIGDLQAAQLRAAAGAQYRFMRQEETRVRTELANGRSVQEVDDPRIAELFAPPCACEDCEAAVSPLAYLADLLAYAVGHVKDGGNRITLSGLTDMFFQPFGALPADCAEVERKVRQVRLCIEILRRYLIAHPSGSAQQQVLAAAETVYLQTAYTLLLARFGVSFAELRLARRAEVSTRQRLAGRLGIDLVDTAGNDTVNALFRDLTAAPAQITEAELESLFGLVDTTRDPLLPAARPALLRWRLEHLRSLWRQQDGPTDPYADDFEPADGRLPIIDPDLLGPDDFRTPFVKADTTDPDAAFDLWWQRRQWVDDRLRTLSVPALRRADGTPDFAALLGTMYQPIAYAGVSVPVWAGSTGTADFAALARAIAQGADADAVRRRLRSDLHLSPESFARLMVLRAKDQAAQDDVRNPAVSPGEWRELHSILVQAQKEALFAQWRAEEAQASVRLGPAAFWLSLREPQEGDWPPAAMTRSPLLDPDLVLQDELAELMPGKTAVRLWQRREANLVVIADEIRAAREAGGDFGAMLRQALGDPAPGDPLPPAAQDLATLRAALGSVDPQVVRDAETTIATALFLPRRDFERLMAAQAASPGPSPAGWEAIYRLLTAARKRKQEYPLWQAEEAALPLLDPEIVRLADLPEPAVRDRARALWQARLSQLDGFVADLRTEREAHGFDAMLQRAVIAPNPGDPAPPHPVAPSDLFDALGNTDAVVNARARAQIGGDLLLTIEDFRRLMLIRARSEDPNATQLPTAAEWSGIYALLATAQKEKRAYPDWLVEERDALSGVPYWAAGKARLPRWRASAEARGIWKQALRTRSRASLIDPDLIGRNDLGDRMAGAAFDLWWSRVQALGGQLTALRNRLPGEAPLVRLDAVLTDSLFEPQLTGILQARFRAEREANGLDSTLRLWHGGALPDLDALAANLAAGADPDDTHRTITDTLGLEVPGFQRLMQIRSADQPGHPPPTAAGWTEVYGILARARLLRTFLSLAEDRSRGEDIAARTEQLSLAPAAFNTLVQIRSLATRGQAVVLEPEWQDVYGILVQVWKRRAAADWRSEEQAGDVTLAPDTFRIPDPPPLTFPPPARTPLPVWRASEADRRDWQDALQARIDQESSVVAAYEQALSNAEAELLPPLRDALVQATNAQLPDLRARARWITDRLLIDAEADGCQITTRIEQAIETLQSLLWSLRTGQLRDTYPNLTLDADDFDEEWTWIGSYASWRAATFVFLYPENILLPSLRPRQTPAFSKLVTELRGIRALSPEQACESVQAYEDYFRDVCGLTLVAACEADTLVHEGNCRNRAQRGTRRLQYLFASGQATQAVYWSTYDAQKAETDPDFAQTFWAVVPGVEPRVLLLGAVPYALPNGDRYLHLFLHDKRDPVKEALLYTRYNLETQEWDGSPGTLDWPDDRGSKGFNIVVKQRGDEVDPPHLAVQIDGIVLANRMKSSGDGWDQKDWTVLAIPAQEIGDLVGMVGVDRERYYLFARTADAGLQYRYIESPQDRDPFWRRLGRHGRWIGAFAWPGTEAVYAFWNDTGDTRFRRLQTSEVPPPEEISPGNNQFAIAGFKWSLTLFDLWLKRATGLSLGTIRVDEVADVGGLTTRNEAVGNVLGLLSLEANERPRSDYVPSVWENIVLRIVQGLEKLIHDSKDWTYADDLLHAVCARRLLEAIGILRAQTSLELPDGRKGGVLIGNLLLWFVGQSGQPPYYEPPGPEGNGLPGMLRIFGCPEFPASAQSSGSLRVAYQKDAGITRRIFRSALGRDAAGLLVPDVNELPLVPLAIGPLSLTEQLSEAEREQRRQDIERDCIDNASGPRAQLVYIEETAYFVPVHLALQLQRAGHYVEALDWFRTVYDYSLEEADRRIYYGLVREAQNSAGFRRVQNWLSDPLNPHAIAELRANTYTRFTLLSLVRCLLNYADAEFTRDTAESIARARTLYQTALDLLGSDILQQSPDACDALIGTLDIETDSGEQIPLVVEIKRELSMIGNRAVLSGAVQEVGNILQADGPLEDRLASALAFVQHTRAGQPPVPNFADLAGQGTDRAVQIDRTLLRNDDVAEAARAAGEAAANDFRQAVAVATGQSVDAATTPPQAMPWLRVGRAEERADRRAAADGQPPFDLLRVYGDGQESASQRRHDALLSMTAANDRVAMAGGLSAGFIPAVFHFCIPPNPVLRGLRLHAELNLYKLHTCRNIAGVKRVLDPYSAPTDTVSGLPQIGTGGQILLPGTVTLLPTPYRYRVLIERARQLADMASRVEAAMLAAIERGDAETYTLLKARQDVALSAAGVRLQELRVKEAEGGVGLAELQQERAEIQAETYQEWLDAGLNEWEQTMIGAYQEAATIRSAVAYLDAATVAANALTIASTTGLIGAASAFSFAAAAAAEAFARAAAASSLGQAEGRAQVASIYAGYERRAQEWELQKNVADQDVRIGAQQVRLAEDHVRVAGQERSIAQMQAEHANSTLDFLTNKFTNADLYDWMSDVLEHVYHFFLQQATATAKLAENQLAFERKDALPALIQADYWVPSGELNGNATNGNPPDRRGLTGSFRLLQDIQQLDQHAFDTDKRRLQLTKTLSLARLTPAELQRFRDTGQITFATSMELFDRDFPGHYLRLIKRIRVSLIALIPPAQGIRATLSSTGVSRVVVGGDVFQTVVVRRDPETIALSSPRDASGLFELDPQSEMLFPFEGLGVDGRWDFRLPKAANPFDYRTIADLLVTFEYTALNSFEYQQQVIQNLDRNVIADAPFSFRNQFSDAWYDLHNSDQSSPTISARFITRREDFPPNLDKLRISHLLMYFARKVEPAFEVDVIALSFTDQNTDQSNNVQTAGSVGSVDGVISTRSGSAGGWTALIDDKSPIGQWELTLAGDMRQRFVNEEIEDILFVITYSGEGPEWTAA